jgi:DNA (cytosine-5)-methyltransferase 1
VAGNRAGLSGQRSGLFFELARIINEVKPKWFVLENVPGLLSSQGGQDMQTVLETLAELGYYVAYRVLDSQNFGVAQRRKRVFFVGSLGNPSCVQVLFEPESIGVNISQGKRMQRETAGTTGSLTTRDFKGIGTTIDGKLVIQDQGGSVINFGYDVVGTLRREEHGHNILILDHTQGESRVFYNKCPTLNTNQGGQRQPCAIKTANTEANGDNISTKGISYTLDGSVNQAIVQDKIRRLTPLEYERLQGFPDNWTDNLTDTQRYKTLGNAVTVNVIEWIAKRIMDLERQQ